MKLRQLKQIIREELKNLNEQKQMTGPAGGPVSPAKPGRPNVSPAGPNLSKGPAGQVVATILGNNPTCNGNCPDGPQSLPTWSDFVDLIRRIDDYIDCNDGDCFGGPVNW